MRMRSGDGILQAGVTRLTAELASLGVPVRVGVLDDLITVKHQFSEPQLQPLLTWLKEASTSPGLSGELAISQPALVEEYSVVAETMVRGLVGQKVVYDPTLLSRLYDHTGFHSGPHRSLESLRDAIALCMESWPPIMKAEVLPWLRERCRDSRLDTAEQAGLLNVFALVAPKEAHELVLRLMPELPGLLYRTMGRIGVCEDLLALQQSSDNATPRSREWYQRAIRQIERREGTISHPGKGGA